MICICVSRVRFPGFPPNQQIIKIKTLWIAWIIWNTFVKGNVTLQISLHSFDEEKRNWLIPYPKKMSIEELGRIRTESNLKTTINLTLVNESDFDTEKLEKYFDKEYFFVKLSPINPNNISEKNNLGNGIIEGVNLV